MRVDAVNHTAKYREDAIGCCAPRNNYPDMQLRGYCHILLQTYRSRLRPMLTSHSFTLFSSHESQSAFLCVRDRETKRPCHYIRYARKWN